MISIRADVAKLQRQLSDVARRQLPFALSLAINDTSGEIKDEWERLIATDLDSPTPFTKRGVYVRRASKGRLTGEVGIKDLQADYLRWQVRGGRRAAKGRAVPVPVRIRLNKYGNMPKTAVARALVRKDTFVGKVRGVPGIWKRPTKSRRKSQGPTLLVAFEPTVAYTPKLDLAGPARRIAERRLGPNVVKRLRQALATAR